MDLHPDMKKQLMAMAGIKDASEFDQLVRDMGPAIRDKVAESAVRQKQHSPFQIHFVQMLDILEKAGSDK